MKKQNKSKNREADRAILKRLKEEEWTRAYAEHDDRLLDKILHEDFRLIDAVGFYWNKKSQLIGLELPPADEETRTYIIRRFEFLSDDVALICGTGYARYDEERSRYQSSNVFVKKDGEWQLIASHVSGLTYL